MPAATGTVLSLHRHPVKSMAGEPVGALRIDSRGAAGDRTHALIWTGTNRRLTARQAPRMLLWQARYGQPGEQLDPADPPTPLLTAPDGRQWSWDDVELAGALEADLGWPVTLRRDVAGQQDIERTLLITTSASLDRGGEELGRELDLRRFRPNIHVELDAPPFAEERWEGRTLQVGNAQLHLIEPCERCVIPTRDPDTIERSDELTRWLTREHRELFGINAEVPQATTIHVGDHVTLH